MKSSKATPAKARSNATADTATHKCVCAEELQSLRAAFQLTLEQHQAAVAAAGSGTYSSELEARLARLEENLQQVDDGPVKHPPAKRARTAYGGHSTTRANATSTAAPTATPTAAASASGTTQPVPAAAARAAAVQSPPPPEAIMPPLLLAAQRGDVAAVRGFLKSGVRVIGGRDDRGDCALHHAARAENPAALVELLNAAAEEEATDDRSSAIGAAAAAEIKNKAKMETTPLKEEGKKPEDNKKPDEIKKPEEGKKLEEVKKPEDVKMEMNTEVEAASNEKMEEGEVDEARKVRAAGQPGHWLRSPLHAAAAKGRVDSAKILLSAGAGVDARDADGAAPLHLAAAAGHLGVVELLLNTDATPGLKDTKEQTALHLAAGAGHVAVVKHLLSRDGKGAETAFHKRTPLLIACGEGHVEVVEALLDAGASMKDKDRRGYSALHTAAERGHPAVVKLLLAHAASPDTSGDTDVTPLYCAARSGHAEVVTALLEAGADIRRRCGRYRKESALAAAACFGHANAVEALLRYGAADGRGEDVREALVSAGSAGVVWALASARAAPAAFEAMGHIAMRRAAKDGQAGVVRALLAAGVFHGSRGSRDGKTPLLLAAGAGHAACVRALLDAGADPHWTAGNGAGDRRTALHEAAINGHAECVSVLVKRGSRIDAEDKDGKTALLLAAEKLHLNVVRTLLRLGASVRFLDACKEEAVRRFVVDLCIEQLKTDDGF